MSSIKHVLHWTYEFHITHFAAGKGEASNIIKKLENDIINIWFALIQDIKHIYADADRQKKKKEKKTTKFEQKSISGHLVPVS